MIVFYNPHVDDFLAEPPHFHLLKRRPLKKYGYILEGALTEKNPVQVFVDGTVSAFFPSRYFFLLPGVVRQWIANREIAWWIRINNLDGRVLIRHDIENITTEVLFAFSYKAATGAFEQRVPYLSAFDYKIFHLSHYFIATGEKAENLRRLGNLWLAGDSDITANAYFQKYFAWYDRPYIMLPFAVAPRFEVRQPFQGRKPQCVATGTFHNLYEEIPADKFSDYTGFFGISTYHPVRKMIHDNAAELTKWIVSKISLYRGKTGGGRLRQVLKHFSVSQKAYFGIDIVELYNQYKYAIVGEEAVGFPALGAFEAMACGCVLLAQPEFYVGWGLSPGEHFVEHDGSLESIVAAIEMLNAHPDKAAAIADAGAAFVDQNCRPETAYFSFVERIERIRSL